MQIQRSSVFLAVLAATAVVGVGAQAAVSRTAATLPTPPASPSSTASDGGSTPSMSAEPIQKTQPPTQEQTPMPSEPPQDQTDWEQQWQEAIAKTRDFGATLIGMNITEAEQRAQTAGFTLRIVERDGESFAITMDYRTDRVNVKVTKDIITEYSVG